MNTKGLLGGLAAMVLLAAPLAAQQSEQASEKDRNQAEAQMQKAEQQMRYAEQQMREAERALRDAAQRMARLRMDTKLRHMDRKLVVFSDRPRLGVVLQSDPNAKTDAIGAYVEALTPGGPAEDAGLQPGDIIVKFNGEPLAASKGKGDDEESAPTARLMDLAHDLKDGDKVTLEYRRGSDTKTVTVTATRAIGPRIRMLTVPEPPDIEIPDIEVPDVPDIDVDVHTTARAWRDMELVALNPELGEYFGTGEGILVVSTPPESAMKLKPGDVILKIGDRAPNSPAQAMRMLRSYEPGENVPLQVMRKREKLAIPVQLPPHRTGTFRWYGWPSEAPEPPAAPAPPGPPIPKM